MSSHASENDTAKQNLRRQAYAMRRQVADKDLCSRRALERLIALSDYQQAATVLWYVHFRSELRTQWFLPQVIESGKRVVVPYCTTDSSGHPTLGLWRLHDVGDVRELVEGRWGILAPPVDRWQDSDRFVDVSELDCIVVPGVAFTREGVRLGNGQGYYDHLLSRARNDCSLCGVCYEAQLFLQLPTDPHDVMMDFVITEDHVYPSQSIHPPRTDGFEETI